MTNGETFFSLIIWQYCAGPDEIQCSVTLVTVKLKCWAVILCFCLDFTVKKRPGCFCADHGLMMCHTCCNIMLLLVVSIDLHLKLRSLPSMTVGSSKKMVVKYPSFSYTYNVCCLQASKLSYIFLKYHDVILRLRCLPLWGTTNCFICGSWVKQNYFRRVQEQCWAGNHLTFESVYKVTFDRMNTH